jgi:hypothetical protein
MLMRATSSHFESGRVDVERDKTDRQPSGKERARVWIIADGKCAGVGNRARSNLYCSGLGRGSLNRESEGRKGGTKVMGRSGAKY